MAEPMTYESHRPKGHRPPHLKRGDGAVGLSVDEIAEGSEALRVAFPLASDATTMAGLAAFRRELPFDWPDALDRAREALAAFNAMSTLRSQAMSDPSWAAGRRENVKLAGSGK